MPKTAKFNFRFAANNFALPQKDIRTTDWYGNSITPIIEARPPIAGKLIKQFVKANYPGVVCAVKSDSFSMGNSLDVWVCHSDGSPIAEEAFEAIRSFTETFVYGRFNGYEDYYEHHRTELRTECGVEIKQDVKYAHTNNSPRWGSVEAAVRDFVNGGQEACEETMNYADFTAAKRAKVAKIIASL